MPEWKPEILRCLAPLKLSPAREEEIAEEIAQHLEDRYHELLVTGESEDAAFRTAIDELNGEDLLARSLRAVESDLYREPVALGKGSINLSAGILQDIHYAFRMMRKSPGFTTVAVLTLALGIGANTAIFSFVDAVLLKPLPYPHPERMVSMWEKAPEFDYNPISTLNFLDWMRQNRCFQFLSVIAWDTMTLTSSDRPQQFNVSRVSASYFKVFGVGAALGRTFAPSEDEVGKDQEVVLSNRIWQSQFGGDPKVIGRTITLDAKSYTIIGVLPANSTFDRTWAVMWVPIAFRPADMTRNYHWLSAIARLRPDVTLKYPESNKGWGVTLDPYIDQVVDPQLRRSLWNRPRSQRREASLEASFPSGSANHIGVPSSH
jgi:hypothetical protein